MGSRTLRVASVAAVSAAACAAAASTSSAVVTLGPNPLPQRTNVTSSGGARIFANAVVPGATLASPMDGIVTRWRVRRGNGGGVMLAATLTLRILRPTGLPNQFTAAGTSDPHNVPGGSNDPVAVYEFPTTLPIRAGDRIGQGTNVGEFTALAQPSAGYLTRTNALDDGQTATFTTGAFPNQAVLINADVEPDANCNGLGDETQDAVVSGGCLPPKAASLAASKAKAAKGVASVPLSCALAGGNCNENRIVLKAKTGKAAKAKKLTLGSNSFSIAAGQSQPVPVPLSKRARKLLKKSKRLKVTATITGGSSTTVAKLTLKR